MRITGETNNKSRMAIQSWVERLLELTAGHKLKNSRNINKLDLFLKTLPEIMPLQKSRGFKVGRKNV